MEDPRIRSNLKIYERLQQTYWGKLNVTTTEEFAFIHDYNNFSSFGVKIWNNKNSEHESASIVIKQPIKTVTIFIRNKRSQFRCALCGLSRWQHIFVIQVNYWLRITDLQQLFQTASWETPTFTDHWPTFMFHDCLIFSVNQ